METNPMYKPVTSQTPFEHQLLAMLAMVRCCGKAHYADLQEPLLPAVATQIPPLDWPGDQPCPPERLVSVTIPAETLEDRAVDTVDSLRAALLTMLIAASPDPQGDIVENAQRIVLRHYESIWNDADTQAWIAATRKQGKPICFDQFVAYIASLYDCPPDEPIFERIAQIHWQRHAMIRYAVQKATQTPVAEIVSGVAVIDCTGNVLYRKFKLADGSEMVAFGMEPLPQGFRFAAGYTVEIAHATEVQA